MCPVNGSVALSYRPPAGAFAQLRQLALNAYDRIVGLLLEDIAVDGCITKAPGGGELAGPSPVDRRKLGMKRFDLADAIITVRGLIRRSWITHRWQGRPSKRR